MKNYGSKIIGVVSYAQANGGGTDIRTTGYGGVENVSAPIGTVATDLGLTAGLHSAFSGNPEIAVSKDQIAVVEENAGNVQIRFAGGTAISVTESYADVAAALGV